MNDRRDFLGLCAGAAGVAASAAATAAKGPVAGATQDAAGAARHPSAPRAAKSGVARCEPSFDGIMGRGYARGPHGMVHFHDSAGIAQPRDGELPLLLLHQSPASARQFEAAFRPLARRNVRIVAIDTPGFGFSDPTPAFPKLEEWASSFVAVMDHLGIARADVLGHHTGALNATEIALQFPTRVRRLILNGPFPVTAEERQKFIAGGDLSHERGRPKLDGSHLLSSFETRVRMWGPNPDPVILTRIVAEKYQTLGPYTWGHDSAYRYDHAAALERITHPTLILTNTGDDIYELAKRAATLRPDFDYVEIQGGTHDIVDQQPEAWSDAVVAWLRRPGTAARG